MKCLGFTALVCIILPIGALAATPDDMIGYWQFAPALSRHVGSMARASVTTSISLSERRLIVEDVSRYFGKDHRQRTVYDLSGAPVTNTSKMGGACTTVSRWARDHLKTDWTCPGALAGATFHYQEDRYLIHAGTVMILESRRAGAGAVSMGFVRK